LAGGGILKFKSGDIVIIKNSPFLGEGTIVDCYRFSSSLEEFVYTVRFGAKERAKHCNFYESSLELVSKTIRWQEVGF
jgi:hypothetical protein